MHSPFTNNDTENQPVFSRENVVSVSSNHLACQTSRDYPHSARGTSSKPPLSPELRL